MIRFYMEKDYDAMSYRAASFIAAQVLAKPTSVLGLATGSTPIGMYNELAKKCADKKITFKAVRTVNLDEYYGLSPEHDQSYRYFMNKNFFDKIDIDKANTNVPNGQNPDPVAECARYDALIDSFGGIDLQLLGIGRDGHIGFNEPGDAFIGNTNYVKLTEDTIDANSRFFASADDVPRYALTTGIRAIMQAKKILMVVNGEAKAKVLEEAFFGPITPANPASILQLHADVVVCGDAPAMAYIAEKHPEVLEK
ncbi:MAG: glucosamine-6-phosphate deaminase [Ruminococcaceae bacterium]|nr:glucosamine-6-phosphate deaminase [Oscillospiraceae bacterium]